MLAHAKLLGSAVLIFTLARSAASAELSQAPSADTIFALGKGAWRARIDAPYVTFSLRERYVWRGRVHDNWWTASYRNGDRNLVLQRMVVAQDEAARMRGFPIRLNVHMHKGVAQADTLDTNADADAFPILDPLIPPDASFGMLSSQPKAALVGDRVSAPALVQPSPSPRAIESPATSAPSLFLAHPLRELVRVEAAARDYRIALAGVEHLAAGDAYHLTLTPLRDPQAYRLRDLWVDTTTFATLQLAVQGLFEGKPYDGARWIVSYVAVGGRYYVQEIRSDDALRFGLDRTVSDLQYDFVSYAFPATLPDATFRHFL